ncbi:MAG: hypothetical protein QM831_22780 [Kofleriaceae bacterium]
MSTNRPKPSASLNSDQPNEIVAEVIEKAEAFVENSPAATKVKEAATEQLTDLRSFVADRPVTAIAISFGVGIVLRSWFRGPTSTLLLMGGAAYLGSRYLGAK